VSLSAGLRAYREGDLSIAASRFHEAALASPDDHRAWSNLGVALRKLDRFDAAEFALRRAVTLAPEGVIQLEALGCVLYETGRPHEALEFFEVAIRVRPDLSSVRFNRSLALLAIGRYAEGWPDYELRSEFAQTRFRALPASIWRGEGLEGRTLFVHPEQGLGDAIMASRFVPALEGLGARVVLATPPPLTRLFASMGLQAFPQEQALALPPGAMTTLYLSLPGRLGVTATTIPAPIDLQVEPTKTSGRVGVVTNGNPKHGMDRFRSLPADIGAGLLALPGAISLDPASTGATDMLETAQLIAGLDLVITVDTAVAHLAGAMGKPVWILLSAVGCDWRWMTKRADTPWYPSARLFRQRTACDWAAVLTDVREALNDWRLVRRGIR
jgi:tetratricopeptide (TPR) repeat protein